MIVGVAGGREKVPKERACGSGLQPRHFPTMLDICKASGPKPRPTWFFVWLQACGILNCFQMLHLSMEGIQVMVRNCLLAVLPVVPYVFAQEQTVDRIATLEENSLKGQGRDTLYL